MGELKSIGTRTTCGNGMFGSIFESDHEQRAFSVMLPSCRGSEDSCVPGPSDRWRSRGLSVAGRVDSRGDKRRLCQQGRGRLARNLAAVVLGTAGLGLWLPSLRADSCRYEADRNAAVAVEDATRIKIIARAGKLEIRGHSDISEIRVHGRACASKQDMLDQIEVETGRNGNEISIEAKLPTDGGGFSLKLFSKERSSGTALLDLKIDVPDSMALDVIDGSGHVEVRDTGPLLLQDGSGDIEIDSAAGDVSIQDGSGDVEIRRVRGDLDVRDGSGSVSITDVAGNVSARDGSGGLRIARVGRNMTVTGDGSGDISVKQVEGDFTVKRDGSGSVHYEAIRGGVAIRD